ncbi:hypothetical protein [Rothia mucilaginosa]|uniref:hypothetical protein n=1 Tax=Rothia mucilaginosa TaxID=43675 RepID=UPI0028897240|nr:hypothetical protein [Rothia mucilaginosa]
MNPNEEPLFSSEENNMLQEIGERTLRMIRQVAAGMKLSNVEVAITYDNCIDVKEFTIRGLLLPISPEEEEETEKKREERFRKLFDQLKQG